MEYELLERTYNTLTLEQQASVSSYADFLAFQNGRAPKIERKPLDFSKYDTTPRIWKEDAQDFVSRMRSDDRF